MFFLEGKVGNRIFIPIPVFGHAGELFVPHSATELNYIIICLVYLCIDYRPIDIWLIASAAPSVHVCVYVRKSDKKQDSSLMY